MNVIEAVVGRTRRRDLPPFRTGDTVRVHVKIREGEKERIQVFEGVVLRRRGGGASETFTVRKMSYGVGVERVFPVQSPLVAKVEIKSRGHVRRSRIYYLRELRGKKARLRSKVRDLSGLVPEEDLDAVGTAAEAAPAEAEAPVVESAETQVATSDEPAAEPAPEETASAEPKGEETPAAEGAEKS